MDLLKRLLALSFFVASLVWLSKAFFLGTYPDFNVFYGGLKAYLQGGNPYLDVVGSPMKFLYPPFALFFFFPLILFPRDIASVIWVALSIVLLITSIVILFNLGKRKIGDTEFFLLSGLVFIMFPVKFNFGMGQFNNVNLFLICLFLYLFDKNRHLVAGASLGLSLLLKVFPLLFLPYLLILQRWRALLMSVGVVVVGLFIPFLFMKSDVVMHFFTTSITGTIISWPLDYYNQALSGFIGRAFGTGDNASLLKNILNTGLIVATFIILWMKRSEKKAILLGFCTILVLSLITLSFSWQHYFVLTIPPFILLYFHYRDRKANQWKYILLALSYLLIGYNLSNPSIYPVIVQSHMLWGTIILWILTIIEVKNYD